MLAKDLYAMDVTMEPQTVAEMFKRDGETAFRIWLDQYTPGR